MKRFYLLCSLVALFILFTFNSSPNAQINIPGLTVSGETEIGGRIIGGEHGSSKFEQYREFREFLWDKFYLDVENKAETHSLQLRLTLPLQEDRNLRLEISRYGKFYFQVEWDQIPHVTANTGGTIFTRVGSSSYTVPDGLQASLEGLAAIPASAILAPFLSNAHRIAVENRQDTGSILARYTPTPDWDLRFKYSLERQNGTIPFAANWGFRIQEVAAPVDWQTQTVKASAEMARKDWSLRFEYDGSLFRNGVNALLVDNLFRLTDSATLGAGQSRHDLYPDNMAHTFSASGSVNLPMRSRIIGTIAFGVMLQDDNFLPPTINSALVDPIRGPLNSVASLPARSLDGRLTTFLINLVGTSRPWDPISITARFRRYQLENHNRQLTIRHVAYDTSPFADAGLILFRRNLLEEYTKSNAGLEGMWQILKSLSFKLGWDWENWGRSDREVNHTNEHGVMSALVYTPRDWVNFRLSYKQSWRRWDRYDPDVVEHSFPLGEPVVNAVFEGLRKFDMANFNMGKVELISQINVTDNLTISPVLSYLRHSYPNSEYGVLGHRIYGYGVNFSYAPSSRVSFFGDFTREDDWYKNKSRYRPVTTVAGPLNDIATDNPANDWWTNRRGITYTFGVGADTVVIPDKLNFELSWNSSWEKSVIRNGNFPGVVAAAQAFNYPDIMYRFHQLLATFKYKLMKNLTAKAQYRYERYETQDYARDVVRVNLYPIDGAGAVTPLNDVYLGAKWTAYEAHIGALAMVFKF